MGKLSLLEELEIKITTGELVLESCTSGQNLLNLEESLQVLRDIRNCVTDVIKEEIINDITNPETVFYAPEYSDWQTFLNLANGNEDYAQVLQMEFSEEDLELLWQNSHISEELTEEEIKKALVRQIGQLKMLALVKRQGFQPSEPQKSGRIIQSAEARIKGLYNMLYE